MPDLIGILRSYEWYEVVIELAIIWLAVYLVSRFLKGTRGAGIIKGFAVLLVGLLVIRVFAVGTDTFGRLDFILGKFVGLVALLLIVVFQPELRQIMIRLGHARFFRGSSRHNLVVDAVADAVTFLSKSEFGALIAIERSGGLAGLAESGVAIDARASAQLIEAIFWPNSPLHDLGVVIRGERVVAASVQFPLAEEGTVAPELGARHRAAVGLSLESDCLVVVVSEETGGISLVEHGVIDRDVAREDFSKILRERLEWASTAPAIERSEAESASTVNVSANVKGAAKEKPTVLAKEAT